MKIICISGQFCSGKTTAIEIMTHHLPNSAIIYGDHFLIDALLEHKKEFKKIYNIPLDLNKPTASLRNANKNATGENIKKYIQFCNIFMPYIENGIKKAVMKNQKQGKDFVLIEYVSLPSFKIWEYADWRIMIIPNKKTRKLKLYKRTIAKREYNEGFELIRENAFRKIIDSAKNTDFIIKNNFNKNFEKDLINLCQKIALNA